MLVHTQQHAELLGTVEQLSRARLLAAAPLLLGSLASGCALADLWHALGCRKPQRRRLFACGCRDLRASPMPMRKHGRLHGTPSAVVPLQCRSIPPTPGIELYTQKSSRVVRRPVNSGTPRPIQRRRTAPGWHDAFPVQTRKMPGVGRNGHGYAASNILDSAIDVGTAARRAEESKRENMGSLRLPTSSNLSLSKPREFMGPQQT